MNSALPYVYLDDEFSLNVGIAVLIIAKLSINSRGNYVLDMEKLQAFLYLIKNPSKINDVLKIAEKNYAPIKKEHIHTIESLSSNVDILFNREKTRTILKKVASAGALMVFYGKDGEVKYSLTEKGHEWARDLRGDYFSNVEYFIESIKSLQSITNAKINSILSITLKGNLA